jgi:hypothetical protein
MTISKRDIKLIMIVLGAAILIACYYLVILNYQDQTEALESEIKTLGERLDVLEGHYERIPEYENAIAEDKAVIREALGHYFNDERPEDFIMFATALENELGLYVSTISFSEPVPVYDISGVADTEDYTVPAEAKSISTYMVSSTIEATMSYGEMKNALDFIYSQKDVTTLESLSLDYNSTTGEIDGSFVVNKYYITGADDTYRETIIPHIEIGGSGLFG